MALRRASGARLAHRFHPPHQDEVLKADPISVFAFMYKPWFWGFEVYNMAKRLMLVSGGAAGGSVRWAAGQGQAWWAVQLLGSVSYAPTSTLP